MFSSRRDVVDYQKHFKALTRLMTDLHERRITEIRFGNPVLNRFDHRITIMDTVGGRQFAFHRVDSQGRISSGEYVGYPDNSEPLIDVAQRWLQLYYRPLNLRLLEDIRRRNDFQYYGWTTP